MKVESPICIFIISVLTTSSNVIRDSENGPLSFLALESLPELDIFLGIGYGNSSDIDLSPFFPLAIECNIGVFDVQKDDFRKVLVNPKAGKDLLIVFYPDSEFSVPASFKLIEEILEMRPTWSHGRTFFILAWPRKVANMSTIIPEIRLNDRRSSHALTIDTNVFIVFQLENSSIFSLLEVYRIKYRIFLNVLVPGSSSIDFNKFSLRSAATLRNDFHGVAIVAVAVYSPTNSYDFDTKFSNETGTLKLETGLSVSLYRDLQFTLGFSEIAAPGSWMYVDENGTLSGRTAQILVKHSYADISISQENMRAELGDNLLTFLHPTYPLSVVAFAKMPEYSLSRDIYLEPFGDKLWICLLIICIWIALCFEIICASRAWLHSDFQGLNEDAELQGQSLAFTTGWLCQQGWYTFPAAQALKILFFTSYLTGVVFYGAFTAALVSKLSVRVSQLNSVEDLLSNQYTLVISDNSASMGMFVKGFGAYHGGNVNIKTLSPETILGELMTSKSALMFYWDSVQDIFSYNSTDPATSVLICESIVTFWVLKNKPSGMVLRKGSPYRDVFNHKILKIKETGLNYRYVKQYELNTQPQCLPPSQIRHNSLSIEDIFSSFLLLLAGFGISLLLISAEILRGILNSEKPA